MKRVLTSLITLLLLLVGVGGANAAVGDVITTLEGISAGKVYTIQAPRGKIVLSASETGIVSDFKSEGTVDNTGACSTAPGADQWAVVPYKNFYLLYNVAKGQFLSPKGSFGTVASDEYLWSLLMAGNPTGDYVFKFKDVSDGQTGGNTLNNNNSGSWPCNGWGTEDNGNRLMFTEAGDIDLDIADVNWSVVGADEDVKYSIAGASVVGSNISLTLPYAGVVLDPAVVTVSADGNNVTSTYTVDETALPFKYSKSFGDATWYRMAVLRNPEKNCKFDGTNINNVAGEVTEVTNEYLFALVGDPFGFNLYNYAAGKEKPIGPATSEGNPRLAAGDAAGTFIFEYSPTGNGHQIFRFADGETAYINDVSSYLGVWRTTNNWGDDGSNFKFTEAVPRHTYIELEDIIAQFDGLVGSDAPGAYPAETLDPVLAAVSEVKALGLTDASSVDDISAAYEKIARPASYLVLNELTEGYYTLFCDNAKIKANGKEPKAMYVDASALQVRWGKYEENSLKFVFKVTANADGTYNLQSAENAYYAGGSASFCGVASATAAPEFPATFNFYAGTGSCYIKANNWTYCPQGNPNGDKDGPSYVWGYNGEGTSGGNVPYAEWTWRLSPVADATIEAMMSEGLDALLASLPESVEGGDDPNTYTAASVEAYAQAIETAEGALNATADLRAEAYMDLMEAVGSLEVNPITEGYYFITSAGNGPGYSDGPYNYEDKNALYNADGIVQWKAYSKKDKTEIYKFEAAPDGWMVYNVADGTYINKGTGAYNCDVTTTAEATTSQKFVQMGKATGKFAIYSETYAYGLANNHNGSPNATGKVGIWGSTSEAAQFGVNQWFLHKISDEEAEDLLYPGGYWEFAETATMPIPGKKYAMKNAYNGKYLDANTGIVATPNALSGVNIWTVEATDDMVEDTYGAYILKSVEKDGYFQYVDYGSKTFDDGTPYDGYDWYSYAGFNGEFGAAATAQKFTILEATADETDNRTSVNKDRDVEGVYVLTAAATVKDKYYKLGTQNTNAALEPWREDVGWKFFEASFVKDIKGELAKALEVYGDLPTEGSNDPGFYSPETVAPYAAALDAANKIAEDASKKEYRETIDNLAAAYNTLKGADVNPITDGYYYIVNADPLFVEKQGVEKSLYVDEVGDYLKWKTFNRADKKQVFEIKKLESGNFTIQNYATQAYVTAPTDCSKASQGVWTAAEPLATAEQKITYNATWGPSQFELKSTAYSISYHPESNSGGSGASGKIVGWYTSWSSMSAWYLYKVEDADWDAMEQAEITESLKEMIADATNTLNENVSYTQGTTGLIESDASNLSSNASSLSLTKLVNGVLAETTETWPSYPSGDSYLQVDLTGKETADLYLTIAPRTGGYMKADTPKSWIIEGSDDGQTWNFINTEVTDGDKLAEGQLYTYPAIHMNAPYKYVRFTSTVAIDNRTGKTNHFALGEFQLYTATAETIYNAAIAEKVTALEQAIADAQAKVAANNGTNEDVSNLKVLAGQLNEAAGDASYYEIATAPSATIEAGKSYVLKNAYQDVYLSISNGTVPSVNPLAAAPSVWTVEEVPGELIDGNTAYVLKNEEAKGYWKYVNYGEKTWDATTPYDAYDWYDYAGFNGEFTITPEEIQKFTILAPTATGDDSRTSVGGSKELVDNSFVVTAGAKIMDRYFKIGIQNHEGVINSALEPWREDVAWLFYEATKGNDVSRMAELALKAYEFDTESAAAGTDPGLYNAANFEGYTAAVNALKALPTDADGKTVNKAINDLAAAYEKVQEVNPVVPGAYYVLINDNAKIKENNKEEKAMFVNASNGLLSWAKYSNEDLKFVFKAVDGGEENVVYLYNLATGLYTGGATEFCGNFPSTTDPTYTATFNFYPGTGSAFIKANNWTMCPKGNPNGDNDGPNIVWAYNGENGKPFQEVTWSLKTISEDDLELLANNALIDAIAQYKNATFEVKDAPGYCKQENVDAFTTLYAQAKTMGGADPEAKLGMIADLSQAYSTANTDVQPIVDGAYYYVVSKYAAYAEKFGAPAAMYTAPEAVRESGASAVYSDKFDETNAHFLFKFTAKDGVTNGYDMQNAVDGWYLNTGDGDSWYGEVTTCTETPVNAQLVKIYGVGKFFIADQTDDAVSRCVRNNTDPEKIAQRGTVYGWTTITDNIAEAIQWYNAWELIPISDDDAAALIEATKAADAKAKTSFDRLNEFATSVADRVAEYTAAESQLSDETKAAIAAAVAEITAAIKARPYDVVTTAAEYDEMLKAAEALLAYAEEEVNPKAHYWEIAATPSAPEAGKSYIIKNAYNDFYLYAGEDKGVSDGAYVKDNYVYAPEFVWTIEANTVPPTSSDMWQKGEALLTNGSQITSNNTQTGFPTSNLLLPESDGYATGQYIWHTSWDAPLPTGTNTYLQTTFANAEQHIIFSMISSEWNSTYDTPDIVDIYATNTPDEETSWQLITTLEDMIEVKNAHPTFYTSPHIDLGAEYSAVRFVVKKTTMDAYAARKDANQNPYVSLGRFQVYRATASDSYVLKSVSENGYWKAVDYASQTWDATTPYDGYDWYDYAGMNAEFGFADEAQAFTILPAEKTDATTRASIGGKELVDGSYVVTAAEPFLNYLFKLDTQRGTNAALAPWQDACAWLFYEATQGTDFAKEVELAQAAYTIDVTSDQVGTDPGLFNEANFGAYDEAMAALKALPTDADPAEVRAAINTLAEAYDEALVPNPIVDGAYYVLFNDNAKIKENNKEAKAMYINTANNNLYWGKYNVEDLGFVFKAIATDEDDKFYLQSLATGLYIGGGKGFCDYFPSTAEPTYPATFYGYPGYGSYRIKTNDWTLCPQGNPGGDKDGPNPVWGYNGDNGQPYQEWTWSLKTVAEDDLEQLVNNAFIDAIAQYKNATFEVKDQPGYCKQENVDAFNTLYAQAKTMGGAEPEAKLQMVADLSQAYGKANNDVQPVVDGAYYYVVSKYAAYAEKFGTPAAMYTAPEQVRESGLSTVFADKFDENNAHYIFKFTAKEGVENGFNMQNAVDGWYVNTGDGDSWYGEVTTCTETAVNAQLVKPYGVGKFFIADETDDAVSRCVRNNTDPEKIVQRGSVYGWTTITDDIAEAIQWYNAWELIPVSEDKVTELVASTKTADAAADAAAQAADEYLASVADQVAEMTGEGSTLSDAAKAAVQAAYDALVAAQKAEKYDVTTTADDYAAMKAALEQAIAQAEEGERDLWEIAEEPSATFEAGKTYVLKNAYNSKYLSTNGGTVTSVNVIEDTEVWSVEAADDGFYYLKSESEAGYWQYVEYSSQAWEDGTPYDGYDWYNYAGMNAEFGTIGGAQLFTILAPTATEEDSRTSVGKDKTLVENSYVFTAKDEVLGKFYKLGVQGDNAALEPWREDVAWLFYEATPKADAAKALQLAIETYGGLEMQGGTNPGYYSADAVAEYNAAVSAAESALESQADEDAMRAATAALKEAGKKEYETIAISADEVYFIVSAGYGPGYYTTADPPAESEWYDDREAYAMYNADGVVKWGNFDNTNPKFAYKFEQGTDGNWNLKNIADNTYIEKGKAAYGQDVTVTEGAVMTQEFALVSEGKFAITWSEDRSGKYVYTLTASHNGSKNGEAEPGNIKVWGSASEAAKFGVNVWYLIPVGDEMKEKLTAVGGIAAGGEGFSVVPGKGKVTFTSDKAETVQVVSAAGAVLAVKKVEAGETVSINLVPGIYLVNGTKVIVR